jgi:hypothetical protein
MKILLSLFVIALLTSCIPKVNTRSIDEKTSNVNEPNPNNEPTPTPTPIIDISTPTPTPIIEIPTPTPTPVIILPAPTPTAVIVLPTPTPTPVVVLPTPTPTPTPAPITAGEILAPKLFQDFLKRPPLPNEIAVFAEAYNVALDKYEVILGFLNRDDVIRLKMAEWYDLIWHDAQTPLQLVNTNKINSFVNQYKNNQSVYEMFATSYYTINFYDRTRLFSYLNSNNIGVPFGVLAHDYAWVHMLYPDLYERNIDRMGTYTYSQIANNYPKRTMTYIIMNGYDDELHLTTAARWHKLYLKKNLTILELKLEVEVQLLASEMSNANYRDVRVLAELINSDAYLTRAQ